MRTTNPRESLVRTRTLITPSRLRTGFGENCTWDTTSRWFDGTLGAGIEISPLGGLIERIEPAREIALPL